MGAMIAASSQSEPLPSETETRMEQFSELLATSIANADSLDRLIASRARLVTAGDAARRRVVQDLHDGAQQRLVHAIITLKLARQALVEDPGEVEVLLTTALEHAEHGKETPRTGTRNPAHIADGAEASAPASTASSNGSTFRSRSTFRPNASSRRSRRARTSSSLRRSRTSSSTRAQPAPRYGRPTETACSTSWCSTTGSEAPIATVTAWSGSPTERLRSAGGSRSKRDPLRHPSDRHTPPRLRKRVRGRPRAFLASGLTRAGNE